MVEQGAWTDPVGDDGQPLDESATLDSVVQALRTERAGLDTLIEACGGDLGRAVEGAVDTILGARGRVIVTGIGKSGHVGRKIAATFASTGTASMYLHPAEASHGDLGMVTRDDVVLALSWSGETTELRDIIHYTGRYRIPLLSITSASGSALAQASTVALIVPKVAEACPHNLAPTSSTLIQLALGDAIAVALLLRRGFTASHFHRFHPGGKLGVALLKVGALMRQGADLPLVDGGADMKSVLLAMSAGLLGCAVVIDEAGGLRGLITDGDVRRALDGDLLSRRPDAIMTLRPQVVSPDLLASAALELMNARKIAVLPVVEAGRVVGVLHMHQLVSAGLA